MNNMADTQLRVLLVLPNLHIGGSQEAVRTLAQHLAADGCSPVVCSLFAGGPLLDDLAKQGTPVEVLRLPRHRFVALPWYVADMLRLLRRLAGVIRKYRANVVQTYILGSQHFLVLGLARLLGVPVVILNFRNEKFLPFSQPGGLKNRLHRLAYRLARRWASGYVAVSAEVKQAMLRTLGLSENDVTVICNGVDVDRYARGVDREQVRCGLGLSAQDSLAITVATLKAQKGHRYLIEAAAKVVRQHPDTHFLLVGDGELRAELEAHTRALGLADRIHFLGSRRDVSELLAASDVFILPSLWEGLSMALLEAMAAAKPIVATAVSGTEQTMVHGQTGLLVPPSDAPALAQAIHALLSDPERARSLGQAARRRAETHFSTQQQAAEYVALYRRLLLER
jgi:glycosyltransferase involved in cell wall biosynthesis